MDESRPEIHLSLPPFCLLFCFDCPFNSSSSSSSSLFFVAPVYVYKTIGLKRKAADATSWGGVNQSIRKRSSCWFVSKRSRGLRTAGK